MNKEQKRKRRLRWLGKISLDDSEDELVLKRRFLSKKFSISNQWSKFSCEYALDINDDSTRDAYGVSKEEYSVTNMGHLINSNWWAVK